MLECASNLACVGAEPLGTTNNLNFGNPEKPHIAWQLTESVRGLGDACRALRGADRGRQRLPLQRGRAAGPIYPTPVIGMVGRLPDARRAGRLGFARAGDTIALVGPFAPSLAASELAKLRGEPLPDGLAEIDIDAVRAAQVAVRERRPRRRAARSAHDIAEGGLAVALAECCLAGGPGRETCELWTADRRPGDPLRCPLRRGLRAASWSAARPTAPARAGPSARRVRVIGTVGGDALQIGARRRDALRVTLAELARGTRRARGAVR